MHGTSLEGHSTQLAQLERIPCTWSQDVRMHMVRMGTVIDICQHMRRRVCLCVCARVCTRVRGCGCVTRVQCLPIGSTWKRTPPRKKMLGLERLLELNARKGAIAEAAPFFIKAFPSGQLRGKFLDAAAAVRTTKGLQFCGRMVQFLL